MTDDTTRLTTSKMDDVDGVNESVIDACPHHMVPLVPSTRSPMSLIGQNTSPPLKVWWRNIDARDYGFLSRCDCRQESLSVSKPVMRPRHVQGFQCIPMAYSHRPSQQPYPLTPDHQLAQGKFILQIVVLPTLQQRILLEGRSVTISAMTLPLVATGHSLELQVPLQVMIPFRLWCPLTCSRPRKTVKQTKPQACACVTCPLAVVIEASRETGVPTSVTSYLQHYAQGKGLSYALSMSTKAFFLRHLILCIALGESLGGVAGEAMPSNNRSKSFDKRTWREWDRRFDDRNAGTDDAYNKMAGEYTEARYDPWNKSSLLHLHGMHVLNGFLGITSTFGLQQWPWKGDPILDGFKKVLVVCVMGSGSESQWIRECSKEVSS